MKIVIAIFLFGLLLVWCWPLAILLLLLVPVIWLLSIPFRLVGIVLEAGLKLLRELLLLPSRALGAIAR